MTDIARDLRTWLLDQGSVSALIGNRFTPEQLIENAEMPACAYRIVSTIPEHNLSTGDANYTQTRMQIDCYSDISPLQAQQIANAIRKTAGLQGFQGDMNGTFVSNVVFTSSYSSDSDPPTDGSDDHRYIVSLDCIIGHEDTV